jgi:hypothetical protein
MRRLLARRPSASLWIFDKNAKGDFQAIWRNSRNAAGVGPGELPTLGLFGATIERADWRLTCMRPMPAIRRFARSGLVAEEE